MPLVDSNSAALWDGGPQSLYRAYRNDVAIGYDRSVRQDYIGNDADSMITALESKGLVRGQRIACIGCGFGWISERLIELGYGPMADGTANGKICSVDTSTWIHENKGNQAGVTIINADVNAATGRRIIRQQFGSNSAEVHWIIDEDVLPILVGTGPAPSGQNEIVPFCNSLRALASTGVAHWVSIKRDEGSQDPRLNWKTAGEWKAWVTPDWVVPRGTTMVQ